MDKNEAVELLNGLSYRPGWTFSAYALSPWEADLMDADAILNITCDTVNTDRDQARKGYPERRELEWSLPVDTTLYSSSDELLRRIFDLLIEIEVHESREFFRQKNEDWAAPFHPHRPEGEARWFMTGPVFADR